MSSPALEFVNIVTLSGTVAGASQSCLLPPGRFALTTAELVALGVGYLRTLERLPLLGLASDADGFAIGLAPAPRALPLLRFAPPYLAAERDGHELRYPIVGGLMVRAPGGHLAFGAGVEQGRLRLWIDVWGYRPRLGLGPLYLISQVQLHRWITVGYMRRALAAEPFAAGR